MKNFYTLLFCLSALVAAAQNQVTFAVDMNGVAEFDAATDVLRVAGSFQNWTPMDNTGANTLTDPDGNGVYSVTLPVADGPIQFKYVINDWDGNPNGSNEFSGTTPGTQGACTNADGNREEQISGDVTLPVYMYNSCDVSSLVISSLADHSILNELTVAPNPIVSQATVRLPELGGQAATIRLISSLGKTIAEFANVRTTTYTLDASSLRPGYYLLDVSLESGARTVRRLTVQ